LKTVFALHPICHHISVTTSQKEHIINLEANTIESLQNLQLEDMRPYKIHTGMGFVSDVYNQYCYETEIRIELSISPSQFVHL